jgi:hypothetical protein
LLIGLLRIFLSAGQPQTIREAGADAWVRTRLLYVVEAARPWGVVFLSILAGLEWNEAKYSIDKNGIGPI